MASTLHLVVMVFNFISFDYNSGICPCKKVSRIKSRSEVKCIIKWMCPRRTSARFLFLCTAVLRVIYPRSPTCRNISKMNINFLSSEIIHFHCVKQRLWHWLACFPATFEMNNLKQEFSN